jgi:hypothetical protein
MKCPHCGKKLSEPIMDGGTCSYCHNNTGLFPAVYPVKIKTRSNKMNKEEVRVSIVKELISKEIAKEIFNTFPDLQPQYEKVTKVALNIAGSILSLKGDGWEIGIIKKAESPENPFKNQLSKEYYTYNNAITKFILWNPSGLYTKIGEKVI